MTHHLNQSSGQGDLSPALPPSLFSELTDYTHPHDAISAALGYVDGLLGALDGAYVYEGEDGAARYKVSAQRISSLLLVVEQFLDLVQMVADQWELKESEDRRRYEQTAPGKNELWVQLALTCDRPSLMVDRKHAIEMMLSRVDPVSSNCGETGELAVFGIEWFKVRKGWRHE